MRPRMTLVFSSRSDVTRLSWVARGVLRDLPTSLRLGWLMTVRDFKTEYKTNKLGYLWAVLTPAMYAVLFVVVREGMKSRGLRIDTGTFPPGLFAFVGIALFQVWMEGLLGQINVIRKNKNLISELRVPPEAFFFAPLFGGMIHLAIRLVIMVAGVLAFGLTPAASIWMLPLLGLALIFTGNAIGFLLTPFSTFYRDIHTAIRTFSLGILLMSPVFYPATTDETSVLYTINMLNPFAATVATARDTILGGDFILLTPAILWTTVLLLLVGVNFLIVRIVHPILMEKLG